MNKKFCIVIVGPTAVGKTSVAIRLAKAFDTRIISADSRQCYRELNIGVAKPSPEQLAEVKHFFINSHSVHDVVNAATFESFALKSLEEIFLTRDIAIMVGGTGLYIDAFCKGMDAIPPVAPSIRTFVSDNYNQHGLNWLQREVSLQDPEYFHSGEMLNPQRLMRALEVKLATGSSIKAYHSGQEQKREFSITKIGLELPRDQLYSLINARAEAMIVDGLITEVETLRPQRHLNALNTVGYKEIFQYLDGAFTKEQAIEAIKLNTRRYAKRQLTWFKRDERIQWFLPADLPLISKYVLDEIS